MRLVSPLKTFYKEFKLFSNFFRLEISTYELFKKARYFWTYPLTIRHNFIFYNIFLPKPSDIAWVYLANTWGFHEVANFQSLKFFYQSQVHGMSINLCEIVYINSGKKLNSFYFCMSASCWMLESLWRVLSFIFYTICLPKTQRYRVGLPYKYLRFSRGVEFLNFQSYRNL
jgi:hypothetical protein